jgi:hypothetical protein
LLRARIKSVPAGLAAIVLPILAVVCNAQEIPGAAGPESGPPPVVTSIRVLQDRGVPAVEILATRPLVPEIHSFDSPPHLQIDLPNARLALEQKPALAEKENILAIRAEQAPKDPPVVRIFLDLRAPYGYSWDAAGNRLMIRLKPVAPAADKMPPASPDSSAHPAVIPIASDPNLPSGNVLRAGSSVAAGTETAILHLSRGGEVHVCPGTSVSVMPSPNRRDLMLGLNTGSLETHYTLDAAAHSILTPDFRILFAGPGVFHFAVSADSHGNTCVRALKGNASSALVSELMGDRFYQVKPEEQAVFHSGKIDDVDAHIPLDCGCPLPARQVLTSNPAPPVVNDVELSEKAHIIRSPMAVIGPPSAVALGDQGLQTRLSNGPETAALPPAQPNDTKVRVDAPFVFTPKSRASVPAPPLETARSLPFEDPSPERQVHLDAVVTPPPPKKKAEHRGFFGHIKGVFGALFH